MDNSCTWIPNLELYENFDGWDAYQEHIYQLFCNDFKYSNPYFEEKIVKIRFHPIEFNKEEAFFHVTCQDYNKDGERVPDFRRCERIRWIRKFIENYNCDLSKCNDCDGIKVWEEEVRNVYRTHILLEEEKYMVVLEKRKGYCLLITAFYFNNNHSLKKKIKKYYEYKARSAS